MKTAELTDVMLDYWVIKALGYQLEPWKGGYRVRDTNGDVYGYVGNITPRPTLFKMSPSTDWSQGGPIIEREAIFVQPVRRMSGELIGWNAKTHGDWYSFEDHSYLAAAMRAYVASKFGETVDDRQAHNV